MPPPETRMYFILAALLSMTKVLYYMHRLAEVPGGKRKQKSRKKFSIAYKHETRRVKSSPRYW